MTKFKVKITRTITTYVEIEAGSRKAAFDYIENYGAVSLAMDSKFISESEVSKFAVFNSTASECGQS
jgi:hypothetical protein